jgi:hypothetical protein
MKNGIRRNLRQNKIIWAVDEKSQSTTNIFKTVKKPIIKLSNQYRINISADVAPMNMT